MRIRPSTPDAARPAAPAGTGTTAEGVGGRTAVTIGWYLAVSAIVFALGAVGVMTRRNPLVVLLCLELMLNGGEPLADRVLAHVGQRRRADPRARRDDRRGLRGDCIGLGMIVAIYRRRLPIDVDELRELQG